MSAAREIKQTLEARSGGITLSELRQFIEDTAEAPADTTVDLYIYASSPVDGGTNRISVRYEVGDAS